MLRQKLAMQQVHRLGTNGAGTNPTHTGTVALLAE